VVNSSDRACRTSSRPPTLRQVADRAEVHPSTASRVLRRARPLDESPTSDRVRRAAAELGYRTHLAAASLRTQRTMSLGVVLSRLVEPVLDIFEGIETAATAAGYSLLVAAPTDDIAAQRRSLDLLSRGNVDGVLICRPEACNSIEIAGALLQDIAPVVQLGSSTLPGVLSVCDDHVLAGQLVGRHLRERGFVDIAIIGSGAEPPTTLGLLDGFRAALPAARISHWHCHTRGVDDQLTDRLATNPRPGAILVTEFDHVLPAITATQRHNLRIPEDLAIISYGDSALFPCLPTPLTSIRPATHAIGEAGVALLLKGIAGHRMVSTDLPVDLIHRRST
jgi:LacI family transcriptional regulator